MTKPRIDKPKYTIIWFRGVPYVVDIVRCRKALVRRQLEGALHNMTSLAVAATISRSTTSRFFSGRSTSLEAAVRILKALSLEFDDACRPASDEEVQEWQRQQEEIKKAQAEVPKARQSAQRQLNGHEGQSEPTRRDRS